MANSKKNTSVGTKAVTVKRGEAPVKVVETRFMLVSRLNMFELIHVPSRRVRVVFAEDVDQAKHLAYAEHGGGVDQYLDLNNEDEVGYTDEEAEA